ncbi:unnamed protein product [Eruca vesicaria subsp. sativa]|uniref:Uncharacterized protein n=1 Tax=Eruca vesicaria subsp. sativa TaxID=29727 RepID=A0ABC8LWI3_ERUVS|nr:unnamed protein product [Eruca vesicaria subsp. sativa]
MVFNVKKQEVKDQKEADALADGFQVGNLMRLVGVEAVNYAGGIEEMYERMFGKLRAWLLRLRRVLKKCTSLTTVTDMSSLQLHEPIDEACEVSHWWVIAVEM